MSLRCTYYRQYVGITNILTLIKRFFLTYVQIIVQHSIVHNMSRKKAFREFMTQAWGREPMNAPPRPPLLTTALNLNFKNHPGFVRQISRPFYPQNSIFIPSERTSSCPAPLNPKNNQKNASKHREKKKFQSR